MAVQEVITMSAVEAVTAATATVAVETMVKQGANRGPFTSC